MSHKWENEEVTITVAGREDRDERGNFFDTDVIDSPDWLSCEAREAIAKDYANHLLAIHDKRISARQMRRASA